MTRHTIYVEHDGDDTILYDSQLSGTTGVTSYASGVWTITDAAVDFTSMGIVEDQSLIVVQSSSTSWSHAFTGVITEVVDANNIKVDTTGNLPWADRAHTSRLPSLGTGTNADYYRGGYDTTGAREYWIYKYHGYTQDLAFATLGTAMYAGLGENTGATNNLQFEMNIIKLPVGAITYETSDMFSGVENLQISKGAFKIEGPGRDVTYIDGSENELTSGIEIVANTQILLLVEGVGFRNLTEGISNSINNLGVDVGYAGYTEPYPIEDSDNWFMYKPAFRYCSFINVDTPVTSYNIPFDFEYNIVIGSLDRLANRVFLNQTYYNHASYSPITYYMCNNIFYNCRYGFPVQHNSINENNICVNISVCAVTCQSVDTAYRSPLIRGWDNNQFYNCADLLEWSRLNDHFDPARSVSNGTPTPWGVGNGTGEDIEANNTLNGAISDTDRTITLTSAAAFTSGPRLIRIDSEIILYYQVSTNDLTNCVRGIFGTTPTSHSNGAVVDLFYMYPFSNYANEYGDHASNPLTADDTDVFATLQTRGFRSTIPSEWDETTTVEVNGDDENPDWLDAANVAFVGAPNGNMIQHINYTSVIRGATTVRVGVSQKAKGHLWNLTTTPDNSGFYDPAQAFEIKRGRIFMKSTGTPDTVAQLYSPVVPLKAKRWVRGIDFFTYGQAIARLWSYDDSKAAPKYRIRYSDSDFSQDPTVGPTWHEIDMTEDFSKFQAKYVQVQLTARNNGTL